MCLYPLSYINYQRVNHFSPAKKIFVFTKQGGESHIYFTTATIFHMWNYFLHTQIVEKFYKLQVGRQPLNRNIKSTISIER